MYVYACMCMLACMHVCACVWCIYSLCVCLHVCMCDVCVSECQHVTVCVCVCVCDVCVQYRHVCTTTFLWRSESNFGEHLAEAQSLISDCYKLYSFASTSHLAVGILRLQKHNTTSGFLHRFLVLNSVCQDFLLPSIMFSTLLM